MSLCRHYVRELRRSVMIPTPDLEKAGSKRSSAILEHFPNEPFDDAGPSAAGHDEKGSYNEQRLSAFLRSDSGHHGHSPQSSLGSNVSNAISIDRPRPSFMTSPDPRTDSNSPGHTVARHDIRASAEKILFTFLLPGSEREIALPQPMLQTIIQQIEEEGRDDPEVFDAAKDYVFQAMERDAYPGFLQAKALGNLVPFGVICRLVFGLICWFAAFWGGFYMILTNTSRETRCWLILPFVLGSYFIATYQYKLDPIMAWLGYSEYTFFNFAKIREPFVHKLLKKRSNMAFMLFAIMSAALCLLFILVPGTNF